MGGLSRRKFVKITAALAVASALPVDFLGRALAQTAVPSDAAATTLTGTIRKASKATKLQYHKLVNAPGESFVERLDTLGRAPDVGRETARRSLVYLGHFTDIHVIDAQSPSRLEPAQEQNLTLWKGTNHPQDTLTVYVLDACIESMNRSTTSPVTGAPLAIALVTGDNADGHATSELRWYIDTFDGKEVTPNSGTPGVYDGVQVWGEAKYSYHPEDPSNDVFGEHGYPAYPGMLNKAVSTKLESQGSSVPWYAVYGNHDVVWAGIFAHSWAFNELALGSRKASKLNPMIARFIESGGANSVAEREALSFVADRSLGGVPGVRNVAPDPKRRIYDTLEFMDEHFDTTDAPGPVGHGFTNPNLSSGETWWAHDMTPFLRVLGLNTCNVTNGADGSIPDDQFRWIESELQAA